MGADYSLDPLGRGRIFQLERPSPISGFLFRIRIGFSFCIHRSRTRHGRRNGGGRIWVLRETHLNDGAEEGGEGEESKNHVLKMARLTHGGKCLIRRA